MTRLHARACNTRGCTVASRALYNLLFTLWLIVHAAPDAPEAAAASKAEPNSFTAAQADTYAVVDIGGHQVGVLIVEVFVWGRGRGLCGGVYRACETGARDTTPQGRRVNHTRPGVPTTHPTTPTPLSHS